MYQGERHTLIGDLTRLLIMLNKLDIKSADPIFGRAEHLYINKHFSRTHI